MADEVSSIANIRRLAAEVPVRPLGGASHSSWMRYERARAGFWQAVAERRLEWVEVYTLENNADALVALWTEWNEIEQLCALVREREGA